MGLEEVIERVAKEPTSLSRALDESEDALVAFDQKRIIIAANDAALRYFVATRHGLIGQSVDTLVPPRLRQPHPPPPSATEDITTIELPGLRSDGTEVKTVWRLGAALPATGPIFLVELRAHASVIADLEKATYAAVFEHSPTPHALARVSDGATVAMNQAFAHLFELEREVFIGRSSTDLGISTPEQRAEVARMLEQQGEVRELECERLTTMGKPLTLSLSVKRILIAGEPHLLSTVQDVSLRKAHEASIAKAREVEDRERRKLHSFLMQAPIAICILEGADHTFTFANEHYLALVGRRDIVGKPLLVALPDVRFEGFDKLLDRVRETAEPFSAKGVVVKLAHHRDEERLVIDFVYQPLVDEEGKVTAILAVVTDVTERAETNSKLQRTSAALDESRARADYAVRLSGVGFWYCDLPFDELIWDAHVKEHFFLPPDARVTIETFYERIVPEDRELTRDAIDTSIRDRQLYDVTYRTHDPLLGEVKWIRAMGGTIYAPDGSPLRFDGVTVDITAQKHREQELAEANRAKDEFLAMLGHELRNPLSPITTAVTLLQRKGMASREIEIIERQARHLTRLVNDLLDISRITRGAVDLHRERCDVAKLVGEAVETASPLVASGKHALSKDVVPGELFVDADCTRMVQVIANLLTNAAKYTPPGGEIRISARREAENVVIDVVDNGVGISPELLPRVFDMFVQSRQTLARSQGGLGLGLAIVKSLVAMHGGKVSAESRGQGAGSKFTVELPASRDAAVA